eukprot:5834499-Pleurochrysis_carterae.AAC.1
MVCMPGVIRNGLGALRLFPALSTQRLKHMRELLQMYTAKAEARTGFIPVELIVCRRKLPPGIVAPQRPRTAIVYPRRA